VATLNDIISLTDLGVTDNKIIQTLITDDLQSGIKAFMHVADKYYTNENDVLKLDFRAYKANGVDKVNENRSNQRLPHNFLKLLINQAVNYIAGKSISYKHDDKAFQEYLDENFMFDFDDNNIQWLKEARKKGKSYLHVYYDKIGKLQYAIIPSEQIIPVYKDEFKKELQEVIRYYAINGVEDGKQVVRKKVEWWNETEVKYYISDSEGKFNLTEEVAHWNYSITTTPDFVEGFSWGKVPFIQLFNNDEESGDLQDIKGFVDAYDIIQSEFINQITDVREILIKVLGYSGSSADEILQAFRGTGIVKIDDATGNIDVLKTEIPVEARQAALKNLKDNIFMIGQGIDPNPEKFGTSISGIALKMLYGPLDLKCSTSIRKLRKALYEFMWFIVEDYNRTRSASINYRDIKFTFNKNMIMNEAEIIDSLQKSKGLISDETIVENHPYVSDPTLEDERMQEQEKKQLEDFNNQVMQTNKINNANATDNNKKVKNDKAV